MDRRAFRTHPVPFSFASRRLNPSSPPRLGENFYNGRKTKKNDVPHILF